MSGTAAVSCNSLRSLEATQLRGPQCSQSLQSLWYPPTPPPRSITQAAAACATKTSRDGRVLFRFYYNSTNCVLSGCFLISSRPLLVSRSEGAMAVIWQDGASTSTPRFHVQRCSVMVAKSFLAGRAAVSQKNSADKAKWDESTFSLIVTPVLNFSRSRCPKCMELLRCD